MRISPQQQRGKKKLKKKKLSEQTKTVSSIQWKKRETNDKKNNNFLFARFHLLLSNDFYSSKNKTKEKFIAQTQQMENILYIFLSR